MAKKKTADIRLYTDGSYYPQTSALGSAWIRATKDGDVKKRGYCINAPENNKAGSLLGEIMAVSEGLRQLTKDMGRSEVTVFTDCKDILLSIVDRDFEYRAGKAKRPCLAQAWRELREEVKNHKVNAIWVRDDNDLSMQEAHKMAQTSANFEIQRDKNMVHHYDIDVLEFDAVQ